MNKPRVVIIGAGIGGLAAHLACRRACCAVLHFERQPRLGPAGAGIVLWPNGVKVLRALGLDGMLEKIGCSPARLVVRTDQDDILNEFPFDELCRRLGAPGYVVSRTELQDGLLQALEPGGLESGANCTGVEQSADGAVARFEDGRRAAGDLIVGADGIHSAVRRAVLGQVRPRYAGFAAWVGIMANEGLIPVDTATEYLADGQRCGLLPLTAGRLYYSFACPREEGSRKPADGWKPLLERLFAGWPPPVRDVIRRLGNDEPICLEIHDLPALPSWSMGRIALLGDAAHATTPTLGQGACQALEDTATLGRCLSDSSGSVADALLHYESGRKGRADGIVALARKGAERMHATTPTVYRDLYRSIRASSVSATMSVAERWFAQGPIS